MQSFYVVVENGEIYPKLYRTYASAVAAVKEKHHETLEAQIKEVGDLYSIESILADVNVPENSAGETNLYIEKGINIQICKREAL
jgi:hypothetical protein